IEISTGMMLPRWLSVAALYCLTKSMMFTPCGPSAVPTGGAGVAWAAGNCTLTTAASLFLLGGIRVFPYLSLGVLDLGDLVERQLDRRFAAEDRHQHLELLSVRVDLVHGSGKRRERAVHNGNGLADLVFHGGRPRGLRLLRPGLGHRCEQCAHLVELHRRRPTGQADKARHPRRGAHHRPPLVV